MIQVVNRMVKRGDAGYHKDGKSGMKQHNTGPHAATRHDSGASQTG